MSNISHDPPRVSRPRPGRHKRIYVSRIKDRIIVWSLRRKIEGVYSKLRE